MKYFASVPWIAELLSTDAELVRNDKSFITKEYRRTDSDLIYMLRKDGADIYFYVLLELQSKTDYTMPFRLLRYTVELLNDLFQKTDKKESERKNFRFPAVVPMVLYDGNRPWTAVRSFKEYTKNFKIYGRRNHPTVKPDERWGGIGAALFLLISKHDSFRNTSTGNAGIAINRNRKNGAI